MKFRILALFLWVNFTVSADDILIDDAYIADTIAELGWGSVVRYRVLDEQMSYNPKTDQTDKFLLVEYTGYMKGHCGGGPCGCAEDDNLIWMVFNKDRKLIDHFHSELFSDCTGNPRGGYDSKGMFVITNREQIFAGYYHENERIIQYLYTRKYPHLGLKSAELINQARGTP